MHNQNETPSILRKHPFDIVCFTGAVILLCIMTTVTFIGATAYGEGMTEDPIFYYLFDILRFPTHTLFFDFFLRSGGLFFGGLLLNVLFMRS
jgi:hypothetical protein